MVPSATSLSLAFMPLVARALDNGAAQTPPMGFNAWMSGLPSRESTLNMIGDFFVSSGLRNSGYVYVNADDAWGMKERDANGRLQPNPEYYPSGLPNFIEKLHGQGLKFGIYGAASGVTCLEMPGQLYFEDSDAQSYAVWGVDYLKSDNCASYALDPSVRFGAMRDALNRTGRSIVLSIEPFSMFPDPEMTVYVSNLARIGTDIGARWDQIISRADLSDKWAPLAAPGYWNDPDMISVQNPPGVDEPSVNRGGGGLTAGENRVYFGLWAIMKAPLLLSANLPKLLDEVIAIVNNTDVIAVNQDALGVQARKLLVDGESLPWLVGLESCAGRIGSGEYYSRPFHSGDGDTRAWDASPVADTNDTFVLRNAVTRRCLAAIGDEVSPTLRPCSAGNASFHWRFSKGPHTVTSVVNVATGGALAVSNGTLFAESHLKDEFEVSDLAYGYSGLRMVEPYDQDVCEHRDCQNYDPSQMWFYSATDHKLRQSEYVASINHKDMGDGYILTQKVPTWQHHCLAHVLSVANTGSHHGDTEVWGGPLSEGAYVVAFLNRGSAAATISMSYADFEIDGLTQQATFRVHSLWDHEELGPQTGGFASLVAPHDIAIFKLTQVADGQVV